MKRKIAVEVKNNAEARAVEAALQQPDVLAFVKIVGALLPFAPRQQERIVRFVRESMEDGDIARKYPDPHGATVDG